MNNATRRWWRTTTTATVVALAGWMAVSGRESPLRPENAGKQAAVKLIAPPPRGVLSTGRVDLICKADDAKLEVNGQPSPWEPFAPPVRVSTLDLPPGRNELRVGEQRVELFVLDAPDSPAPPDGWPRWRAHPLAGDGEKRCEPCHELSRADNQVVLGKAKNHNACFRCHPSKDFPAQHSHPLEPIIHCQMCHATHGSTYPKLLKAPAKKLCNDCHDVQ
jgi:predicted CXXCH cytochrome family protein